MATATLLTGCSFPPQPYVEGVLTSLDAPPTVPAGQPFRMRAHATFAQRYSDPLLNVQVPLDGNGAIAVEAVAAWVEPPLGSGVLGALPYAKDADLETSLTCAKPGTYTITGRQLAPITLVVE